MINAERAEVLYSKMHEHLFAEFNTKELDALEAVMSSEVVLKAFGRSLAYCQGVVNEMAQLDMSVAQNPYKFTLGQGQVAGIKQLISGMLELITEQDEDDKDVSS